MIALDCHFISVVDDAGFVRLLKALEPRYTVPCREYITDTVMPKLYDDVKTAVNKHLSGITYHLFSILHYHFNHLFKIHYSISL